MRPVATRPASTARLTTSRSPHIRLRSTATSTAAGNTVCETRCSTGVIQ